MSRKPIFVYGTLRTGFGNHSHFLAGNITEIEDGTISGYRMVSLGGFPMVFETDTPSVVRGELMHIREDIYDHVLRRLDGLEGEGHFYYRKPCSVHTPSGVKEAEVYVGPTSDNYYSGSQEIGSGDWKEFLDRD